MVYLPVLHEDSPTTEQESIAKTKMMIVNFFIISTPLIIYASIVPKVIVFVKFFHKSADMRIANIFMNIVDLVIFFCYN